MKFDLDLVVKWVLGFVGLCIAAWPVFKCCQMVVSFVAGRVVTLHAFRTRTDALDARVQALEKFRAEAEEERMEKMAGRIRELEAVLTALGHRKK